MLTIKSKREIELMKKAGSIVELALENVHKAIKPGVSTLELDRIAYKTIIENDAIPSFLNYNGFPNTICASINETVIHGIPKNNMILKDGDIISVRGKGRFIFDGVSHQTKKGRCSVRILRYI